MAEALFLSPASVKEHTAGVLEGRKIQHSKFFLWIRLEYCRYGIGANQSHFLILAVAINNSLGV